MSTHLFHRTMEALERGLTCELLASELKKGDGMLPVGTAEDAILGEALAKGYSCVVLFEEREEQTPPWWVTHLFFVDRKAKRKFKETPRPILPDDMISSDTPVSECIRLLAKRELYLVLVQDRLSKIVTRADLNKLPIRVYLSTLLLHLEGVLADTIHMVYPENEWMGLLKPERQKKTEELFENKIEKDFDTRKIDCTTLIDKQMIVLQSEKFPSGFPAGSKKQFERQKNMIKGLRNRIDHGLAPLVEDHDTIRNHIYHGQPLIRIEQVEWLHKVVSIIQAWIKCLTELESGT